MTNQRRHYVIPLFLCNRKTIKQYMLFFKNIYDFVFSLVSSSFTAKALKTGISDWSDLLAQPLGRSCRGNGASEWPSVLVSMVLWSAQSLPGSASC